MRNAVWPTRSFERSLRYMVLRLWRIKATPHSIALGCAVGVFAIFTPFLGCQMLMAASLALLLRGSVMASAVGTFAGNPLTYPVIWGSTFAVGNLFLGNSANAEIGNLSFGAQALRVGIGEASPDAVANAFQGLWPILKPMAVGALPLGGLTAVLVYVVVRRLLQAQHDRRAYRASHHAATASAR